MGEGSKVFRTLAQKMADFAFVLTYGSIPTAVMSAARRQLRNLVAIGVRLEI